MYHSSVKETVFDPTLPTAMFTDLSSGSGSLIIAEPGTSPRSHRFGRRRALSGAATLCVLGTVIVTLDQVAGTWWAWPAALIGSLAYLPWDAADRRSNSDTWWGAAPMLFPWALFPDPAGLIVCAVLQLLVYGGFVAEGRGGVTHVVGRDRLVSLADLGQVERARLSRVRAVCGLVEEAQRLLAPAFDGTLVLMTLREEEWRFAARMRKMAQLAAEVDRLNAEAAADRVRQALSPQAEVMAAARRDDKAVIKCIEQYVRPVEGAIRAHREWEQIQRLADRTDSYTGLLARTEVEGITDGLAGVHDLDGDLALEAARQACEELTAVAMAANTWLLDALRSSEGRRPSR